MTLTTKNCDEHSDVAGQMFPNLILNPGDFEDQISYIRHKCIFLFGIEAHDNH